MWTHDLPVKPGYYWWRSLTERGMARVDDNFEGEAELISWPKDFHMDEVTDEVTNVGSVHWVLEEKANAAWEWFYIEFPE